MKRPKVAQGRPRRFISTLGKRALRATTPRIPTLIKFMEDTVLCLADCTAGRPAYQTKASISRTASYAARPVASPPFFFVPFWPLLFPSAHELGRRLDEHWRPATNPLGLRVF